MRSLVCVLFLVAGPAVEARSLVDDVRKVVSKPLSPALAGLSAMLDFRLDSPPFDAAEPLPIELTVAEILFFADREAESSAERSAVVQVLGDHLRTRLPPERAHALARRLRSPIAFAELRESARAWDSRWHEVARGESAKALARAVLGGLATGFTAPVGLIGVLTSAGVVGGIPYSAAAGSLPDRAARLPVTWARYTVDQWLASKGITAMTLMVDQLSPELVRTHELCDLMLAKESIERLQSADQ